MTALSTQGFEHLPGLVPPDTVRALRAAMAALPLDASPSAYGRIVHDTWRRSDVLAHALLSGLLPALARDALGAAPVLFQDHLVDKTPGTTNPVHWHQDYSYWPLADPRGVTLWVALDDADVENGCLHYVPESHLWGERAPADFVDGAEQRRELPLLPIDVTGRPVVPVPVTAGDVLLHLPLTWHCSPGNVTQRRRRAWSISWVHDDARWDPAHAPHPYAWSLAPTPGARLDPERFPRVLSP